MNAKFKIGDKVKLVKKYLDGDNRAFDTGELVVGNTYVVSGSMNSGWGFPIDLGETGWAVTEDMVELIAVDTLSNEECGSFLNTSLTPFKDITDEQKLLIIREKMKGNVQTYFIDDWVDAINHEIAFSCVYRTKPVEPVIEHTPIDVPWQFIKPEYKWAAMDKDATMWVFDIEPEAGERQWYNGGHGKLSEIEALNIPTEGIVWDKSLTKRPEEV